MRLYFAVFHVEDDIGFIETVIDEVFLDYISFCSHGNDEVVDAMEGIALHDMPKNRPAPDFHHGFRAHGFLQTNGSQSRLPR